MRPFVLHVLGVVAFATFVTPIPSHAQPPQCTGLAEMPGNDMMVSPPEQRLDDELSYFTFGPALYGVWGESSTTPFPHSGGSYAFMFNSGALMHELGHSLSLHHGGPVTTDDNQDVLFVGSDNGRLYKLDAHTGAVLGFVDLRRPGCSDDKLRGTPAVQLYRFSNPAFQSAILAVRGRPDDLVYVIRNPGCGDPPDNRVIGCFASDMLVAWESGQPIDGNCEGVLVDDDSNTLYAGTNPPPTGGNSLFAINSVTGGLKWSVNAGAVLNRPTINPGGPVSELYVGSSDGVLQKRNPSDGSLIWALPTGSPITRNIWPEFRAPFQPNRIFIVAEDGQLHTVLDNFPNPVALTPVSPGPGIKFSTAPAVAPGLGKIFIGRDDGLLQQLTLAGGLGSTALVGRPGTLCDPTLAASIPGATLPDRVMITTTEGKVRRFCVSASAVGVGEIPMTPVTFLGQNVPNPFSARTLINYALPWDAKVEIDIFGVDGRLLRRLVRDQESAGSHALTWNGLDDAGRDVGTGAYFYRLRATGRDGHSLERTKKLQLVK